MLTTLSKLLLLCALVSFCTGEEQPIGAAPFKPVSPVPINPANVQMINALSALKLGQMPQQFNPYASAEAMKMMMMMGGMGSGSRDSDLHMKLTDMPEISRIVCGCEVSMDYENCHEEPKINAEKIDEIKAIAKKMEKILNKATFKNVIVKRSIEMNDNGREMVANGKDAKDDIKLMLSIYETIKKMFKLNDDSDIAEFKVKLHAMSDESLTLRQLIQQLRSSSQSLEAKKCDDDKQKLECAPGTQLRIIKAAITNKNKYMCPASASLPKSLNETCTEETLTTQLLNATCSGKQTCMISVHRDFLNICKCAEQKYLDVTYICDVAPETKTSRNKRAIHYRNKPKQEARDKMMRSGPLFGGYGLYDYGLYGGYGYGYPILDYYGGYGYGYPFDYYGYGGYGYGYGMPFGGGFTYDYETAYQPKANTYKQKPASNNYQSKTSNYEGSQSQ